jgi:hypothetical protein
VIQQIGSGILLIDHRITVGSQSYQLIVLTNIHDEIESNEIESWQKLISILIHEISNSITPISSLSSTVDDMVTQSGIIRSRQRQPFQADILKSRFIVVHNNRYNKQPRSKLSRFMVTGYFIYLFLPLRGTK